MKKLLSHVVWWLKREIKDPLAIDRANIYWDPSRNRWMSRRDQPSQPAASLPLVEEEEAAPTISEAHALLRQWLEETSGAAAEPVVAATGRFDGGGQTAARAAKPRASPLWTYEPVHHGRTMQCRYFLSIMEGSGYRGSKDGYCSGCAHLDIFPACKSEADARSVRIHHARHLHLVESSVDSPDEEDPQDPEGD